MIVKTDGLFAALLLYFEGKVSVLEVPGRVIGQADVTSARVEKIEEVVQSLQLNMVFSTPASEP